MGALPKRRISSGRRGRRRADKKITTLAGRGSYVGSRERRALKKGAATE